MARQQTASKEESAQEIVTEEVREVARRRAIDSIVPGIMDQGSQYGDSELRQMATFEEAVRLTQEAHGGVSVVSEELGDGFALLNDKSKLIGVPCLFMEWAFREGDFSRPFVSVRIAARNPDGGLSRYIINDGSTGLADQLAEYTKQTGKLGGLFAVHGLRVSEYDVDKDGVPVGKDSPDKAGKAATFYIDTSV